MDKFAVLIIDDDRITCSLFSEFISNLAQVSQVITSTSTLDALEILQKRFDIKLIILNLLMPDLDGFEFLANLTQSEYLVQVLVIALSTDSDLERRAIESGAYMFLEKPVRKETLLNALAEATSLLV